MYWNNLRQTARQCEAGIDVAQRNRRGILDAGYLRALARVAVMKVADQIRMHQPGVPGRVSLVIEELHARRGITGKLRDAVGVVVVLQIAAPEHRMLAVRIQLRVELRNVCAVAQRRRRFEAETGGV